MREDQARCLKKFPLTIFQSTSLEWGKTNGGASIDVDNYISIHFPRMREDHGDPECRTVWSISIHFPRMREDTMNCEPYGQLNISIHFPRMREDSILLRIYSIPPYFNPLPSNEGRRRLYQLYSWLTSISIHFPRMREDAQPLFHSFWDLHFNPLPSNEGRPESGSYLSGEVTFQSTSLEWGKTSIGICHCADPNISIHFPRMREDGDDVLYGIGDKRISIHFPRMREDTSDCWGKETPGEFQSTSLEWGKTMSRPVNSAGMWNFNPLPSNEGRRPTPPE